MTNRVQDPPAWIHSAARWLTPRRIRAQAIVLALCMWGVCAVDFATPGLLDHAGNIKFQDFLPLYISAQLIAQGHANELYNQQVTAYSIQAIVRQPLRVRLPYLYGPQVGFFLIPLAKFSFPVAARIWIVASLLIYASCVFFLWRSCTSLRAHFGWVALCAIAFPPLFHFFVRGQMSALVLACFTVAFLAFRADCQWLAGIALGFLVFKPQFLVALPLLLLLAHAWKQLAGLLVAAGAQLAFIRIYFAPAVTHAYFDTLWHISRVIRGVELSLAPVQMHSLRSFWSLLIPWSGAALALYILSAIVAVGIASVVWKSTAPIAIRFSALTIAAVLVNPHLFIYDLLALVPVLLLVVDWTLKNRDHPASVSLQLLLYLAFVLPLFGPLSQWTHFQFSVPAFALLLLELWRISGTAGHKLASNESGVV